MRAHLMAAMGGPLMTSPLLWMMASAIAFIAMIITGIVVGTAMASIAGGYEEDEEQ